ncbi:MAG: RNA polymerase sigma factor [Clostridia bacterium]|nr:RNA polymerase sigma factor [Clostridia bacterium]
MSDNEYVRRVRAMEGRLFRIAQGMLWRYADSADAVQEAVFRGWLKKGGLRETAYFETWLIRILINECKDVLRKRGREAAELREEIPSTERLCEDLHLREALKKLPEKYRMPLLLHHMEGYPIADVSEMLGMPKTQVNSRLHRARLALRQLLDGGEAK